MLHGHHAMILITPETDSEYLSKVKFNDSKIQMYYIRSIILLSSKVSVLIMEV